MRAHATSSPDVGGGPAHPARAHRRHPGGVRHDNKEVAEELVLSVKTIEYHLGNVFTKLQVTSRGRLAAKIAVGT